MMVGRRGLLYAPVQGSKERCGMITGRNKVTQSHLCKLSIPKGPLARSCKRQLVLLFVPLREIDRASYTLRNTSMQKRAN